MESSRFKRYRCVEENVDEAERVEVFRLYSVGDSRMNMYIYVDI